MIISLLQEKGGAGKTTLATNLAKSVKDYKNRGNTVLLVDSDPQGSARDWHTNNDGSLLDVIGLDRPTIDKDIQRFKRQYDYIFIDGAPHLSAMVTKTIICSDLILIPVQPSPYDIWASEALVNLIKQRRDITGGEPRAAFIVSRQITGTKLGNEIRKVLEEYDLPVLEHGTYQRIAYAETAARGETVNAGAAKTDIDLIVEELFALYLP
jgi:chromosome partitioning protein